MAQYAENTVYLKIGGVQVDAYFKSVKLQPSNSSVDTTVGSGTDHMQRAPGLDDTKIDISLGYDAASIQTYIQKLATGQVLEIEYGSQGNSSGKPRHVQTFNIVKADHEVNVTKDHVVFEISGEGADAPTVNMYKGGIYA